MKPELTSDEIVELRALWNELLDRSKRRNSIISTMELDIMYRTQELEAFRFFAKHWVDGETIVGVRAGYNSAIVLSLDPMSLTHDQVAMVSRFSAEVNDALKAAHPTALSQALARFGALVVSYPDQIEFLKELVLVRNLTDSEAVEGLLANETTTPKPLLNGSL